MLSRVNGVEVWEERSRTWAKGSTWFDLVLTRMANSSEARGPICSLARNGGHLMVGDCLARGTINERMGDIRRMLKWAVGEELVGPSVFQALNAVLGLRKGRCDAPDCPRPRSRFTRIHVMAKRSEFIAFFLQTLDHHDVDIADKHDGETTFQKDLVCALGTFAGQADAIMRRLNVFDGQAHAVLERFARGTSTTS